MFLNDPGCYHVPGEYAKRKLKRRYSLALIIAVLVRSSVAALCLSLQIESANSLTMMQSLLQLLLYTVLRTFFVDFVTNVQESTAFIEEELRTDSFVITDERRGRRPK